MLGMVYQNVGRDSGLHEGIWLIKSQVFMESACKCGIESHYINFVKRLSAAQKRDSLNGQRKRQVWDKEENEAGISSVQFTLQHGAPNGIERWCGTLAKTKRHGFTIGRLWIWLLHRLAFSCLFSSSLLQLQKVMCDFKQSTESVGLKIHPDKTTILSNQSTNERKEVEINNIKVEIFSSSEEYDVSRANNYISATGNSKDQKSNQSGLGIVSRDTNWSWRQDRTSYNTDSACSTWWSRRRWATPLARGHYQKNTEESYDQLNANCFASSSKQRKITKKKTQPSRNDEDEEDEKANHRSSDEETAEGSTSNTDHDQDSDISFMNDTDEEIDTGEIEQKDWIDYTKRSTATAVEKMKAAKIPCWIETRERMKWRSALRNASLPDERWAKKAAKWNPGLSTKHQTNRPVGRPKRDGKMK